MNHANRPSSHTKKLVLVLLAAMLTIFGLVGCSSDSDSEDVSKGDASGQTQDDGDMNSDGDSNSDDSGDSDGNAEGLPADLPAVPMPDFSEVTGGSSGADYWDMLLIVDPGMSATADEMLSDYRIKLDAAGFTPNEDDDEDMVGYENDDYMVTAFSPAPGMLKVTVGER